jgi:hypothetical protein
MNDGSSRFFLKGGIITINLGIVKNALIPIITKDAETIRLWRTAYFSKRL